MLVLSRKEGERVIVGNGVEVMVLRVGRGRVQLGFTGPSEIAIHRAEVYHRVVQETETVSPWLAKPA